VQQKLGFKFGARLALIFSDRFDMVTAVTDIPGYAIFRGAGKEIKLTTASHTLSGSTTARYWLKSPVQMLAWEIHTGIGVGFGGQSAYEDLFETRTGRSSQQAEPDPNVLRTRPPVPGRAALSPSS
jgi:hypothetical protein